jgi:hypothetical protein
MSPSINTVKEIMKRSATFIVASGVFFGHIAVAQPQENVAQILISANNIVYVDFAPGFIQLNLSINYDSRRIAPSKPWKKLATKKWCAPWNVLSGGQLWVRLSRFLVCRCFSHDNPGNLMTLVMQSPCSVIR